MITDYKELDAALGRVRVHHTTMATVAAAFDDQIRLLQEQRQVALTPSLTAIAAEEAAIRPFLDAHRADFPDKKRSRKLVNGKVGLRLGAEKVTFTREQDHTVRLCQALALHDCLKTKITFIKAKAKELNAQQLVTIGVELHRTEATWYQLPDGELIAFGDEADADGGDDE